MGRSNAILVAFVETRERAGVLVWGMFRFCIVVLVLLSSPVCRSEKATAIVDAKWIKDTGITSGVMCYREAEEDCHAWRTYHLFKAKIRKIISGSIVEKTFHFVISVHSGFEKTEFKRLLAVFEKIEGENELTRIGAGYYLKDMSFPTRVYCLQEAIPGFAVKPLARTEYCYDVEDINEDL